MSALTDIWHSIQGIVTSADMITLAIAAVVVLVAGFTIRGLNSIVSATVLSLIAFALLEYVRAVTLGHQDVMAYISTDWNYFLDLQMLTLVAYSVIFAALIAVVNIIRSVVY